MNTGFQSLSTSSSRLIIVKNADACGLGCFKPKWMKKFANFKHFLAVFCILGVLQSVYFTYFVAVSSTLEKRFGYSSQTTGILLTSDSISLISISLFSEYIRRSSHKPRLIACGMLMTVLSCFLFCFLHFSLNPPQQDFSNSSILPREFCRAENGITCDVKGLNSVNLVVLLFFIANFLNGFGHSAFYIVGLSYLSERIKPQDSLQFFGVMASLRIFGPILGFLLSSFCLKYYEDPFYDPGIDLQNPRWVGAWWMGFLILGIFLLVFTILLAMFPRQLPERFRSEKIQPKEENEKKPKIKDFPQEMWRLMKNPILVCHIISITFQVNGFAGYFVFMPKFMEAQYQQSASDASLFSGTTGIVSMLVGILLGGFIIMKYKPRPRYLTGYMVLVEIFSVLGLLVSMFLGCPQTQMPGTYLKPDETLNLYNDCNLGCSCTRRIFEPVCGEDGTSTFFSPCFAGCPNLTGIVATAITTTISPASNATIFEACKCTSGFNSTFITSNVTSGFCPSTCKMFIIYIILLCISKFISSTARVGNTLITFRCVEAKDKSFALGAFGSVLSMFAFIPYPLIYGALTDSACLVWEENCSKTGNCWLYDSDKFRFYLHGMSMLLISIGICFDGVVFLLSDRMSNIYGEDDEGKGHGDERIAKWLKEEEEEDIIFTKVPKRSSIVEADSNLY